MNNIKLNNEILDKKQIVDYDFPDTLNIKLKKGFLWCQTVDLLVIARFAEILIEMSPEVRLTRSCRRSQHAISYVAVRESFVIFLQVIDDLTIKPRQQQQQKFLMFKIFLYIKLTFFFNNNLQLVWFNLMNGLD